MKTRQFIRIAIVLLAFLTIQYPAHSQTKKERKQAKKIIKEADKEFAIGDDFAALELYLEAYEIVPDDAWTNFRIGVCHVSHSGEKDKAIGYFEKAYELDPEIDDHILYFIAEGYQYHMDFDLAIEYFNKYIDISKEEYYINDSRRRIKQCEVGKELVASPVDVQIINLGPVINTEFKEYSPVISADEKMIVFTSRRPDTKGGGMEFGEYMEDIYMSKKVDGQWTTPENLESINSNSHEASVGLSPDGKQLIIFDGTEGNGDVMLCKQKKDGTWVKPKPFSKDISHKNSYEPSAVISDDGKKLFFSSNRDEGYGGLDIYVATWNEKKDKWNDPENLGPQINTQWDDDAPFMDIDGKTLYFSSEGHRNMGESDIFKSTFDEENGTWSTPENLGYPINSTQKDLYFWMSGDGRHAYFSSKKEDSYGAHDLYKIVLPKPDDYEERVVKVEEITGTHVEEPELLPVNLYVTVVDDATGEPLEANVSIFEFETEVLSSVAQEGNLSTSFSEEEAKTLNVYASMEGYTDANKDIVIPHMGEEVQMVELELRLVAVVEEIPEPEPEVIEEPVVELMPVNLIVTIEDYVTGERLDAKIQIMDAGTELTSATAVDGSWSTSFNDDVTKTYTVYADFDGYIYRNVSATIPARTEEVQTVEVLIKMKKPEKNVVTVLRNIYFDFDKYTLKQESYVELEKLYDILVANPDKKVELAGHTDFIGPDGYNDALSIKRANAVVNYLVGKGISKSRLVPKGYGEKYPMATNDQEEEGRELNRRTEFKFLN